NKFNLPKDEVQKIMEVLDGQQ
ncbi:MAG: hypothetical protein K0R29_2318, partial [Pseudobdellovibrio sp.]|nr:hypothetical protein [Pseudobdellovibrio sp.]